MNFERHPRPRGLPDGLPFVWDAATLANGTMFTLTTDLGNIDPLAYADAYAASVETEAWSLDT